MTDIIEKLNIKNCQIDGEPTITAYETSAVVDMGLFLENDDYLELTIDLDYDRRNDSVEIESINAVLTDSDGDELDASSVDYHDLIAELFEAHDINDRAYMAMSNAYAA